MSQSETGGILHSPWNHYQVEEISPNSDQDCGCHLHQDTFTHVSTITNFLLFHRQHGKLIYTKQL